MTHLCGIGTSAAECGSNDDFGYTRRIERVTCHKCLEVCIANAERAVARIVELDLESSARSSVVEQQTDETAGSGIVTHRALQEEPPCPSCKQHNCYDNFCGMKHTDT